DGSTYRVGIGVVGVVDQDARHAVAFEAALLRAAADRAKRFEASGDRLERRADGRRRGDRGERVGDVVSPGQVQLEFERTLRRSYLEPPAVAVTDGLAGHVGLATQGEGQ